MIATFSAGAFGFGSGPVRGTSVQIQLKGETFRPVGARGTIKLDAAFRNMTDVVLRGEIRVVVMAINDRIDFDQVVVTEWKSDGRSIDHSAFFVEQKSIDPGERFVRNFNIGLPPESRGRKLQVMVLYYRLKDDGGLEISKKIYDLTDQ